MISYQIEILVNNAVIAVFEDNPMASSIQFYGVTLTNYYSSNSSPSDGFVDPNTIQSYYSYDTYNTTNYYSVSGSQYAFETTPSGLTLSLCTAKRRANHRWSEIIRQLELASNVIIYPASITVTGGSSPGWTPTSLTFQMVVPFGDSGIMTLDETAQTPTYLSGPSAITRCIARALIADQFRELDIFDPTSSTSVPTGTTSVPRFGIRINPTTYNSTYSFNTPLEIGAYASSLTNAATNCITVSYLP